MICRHGNETCDECAKLLSVAEALRFRADNPGTTQQEAADLAGTTREAIAMAEKREAVTKRNELRNVTEPAKLERSAEFETRPLIRELIRLIDGCSALERRYLREVILRIYL